MNQAIMESPVLYILAGCVAAFVIGQSVFFLVKAWREGKRIGMDTKVLKKAAFSGGVFTIVPSLSILFAFLAMQGTLGMVLPWIRLSVLGAVTYEVPAATAAVEASGMTFGQPDNEVFRGLPLARRAIAEGGSMPTAFNASNEWANAMFRRDEIHFTDIYDVIEEAMNRHVVIPNPSVDEIFAVQEEIDVYFGEKLLHKA